VSRRGSGWRRVAGGLLEVLYPGRCLLCGSPLLFQAEAFEAVCTRCRRSLSPIQAGPRCEVCSLPLVSEQAICTRCRRREFLFQSNYSVFEYRGAVRELIHQYKFLNRRRLAGFIARLLAAPLAERFKGLPVVPVPGSSRAVRRRGWDPMEEVARVLTREPGREALFLLGRRKGRPQKGLGYRQRLAQMRETVYVRAGCRPPAEVLLVDDIFTTGATADECARALRSAGARMVSVLTLCID
jgi:competence protein ComFC